MNKQKINPMTEILAGDLANIGIYSEQALAAMINDFLATTPVVVGLGVKANATPDMTVYVDIGRMYQNGLQGENETVSQSLAIGAAPASGTRIDRVCAQYSAIDDKPQTRNAITDVTTRNTIQQVVKTRTHGAVTFLVVSGSAAPSNPAPPAIPVGYVSLAQVVVAAGINNVQQSAIIDERPTIKSLLTHTHTGGNDGAQLDYNKLQNLPDMSKLLFSLSWRGGRTYSVGDVCCPTTIGSNKLCECIVAGTTAAVEPTWPAIYQTVVDGGVTWRIRDLRGGSGRFIGDAFPVLATTPPPGCLDISGGAIVNRATYPDLWAWVQTSGVLITEAAWQSQAASQSSVGFYSSGDGSTTFRLPKMVDFASGTDVGRPAGTWRADDLKAHAHALNIRTSGSYFAIGSSSFPAVEGYAGNTSANTGGAETRPKSISMLWVVKAFDAPTNQGLIDITALANSLLGKVNYTDIIQNLSSNGYWKSPGGFILQWGYTPAASSTSDIVANYPAPFPHGALMVGTMCSYTIGSGVVGYSTAAPRDANSFVFRGNTSGLGSVFIAIGY